jgi:hypothetical protein
MMKLRKAPKEPSHSACANGFRVLLSAHQTCASFINLFDASVKKKKSGNGLTEQRQDLLRAMLVFASSGLDATIKELINDALPIVVDANKAKNGAAVFFASYVKKHLLRDERSAAELIAQALTSASPREDIMLWFQKQLSSESMQSKDQVFMTAAYFDIPTSDLCNDVKGLADVFRVRNVIIHQADVDFNLALRKRTPRERNAIVSATNLLLETAEKFLHEVDRRCGDQ